MKQIDGETCYTPETIAGEIQQMFAFLNCHFGGFQNFQGNRIRSKIEEEQVTLQRGTPLRFLPLSFHKVQCLFHVSEVANSHID